MAVKKVIFKAIETHLMQKLNIGTNAEYPVALLPLKWFDKQMGQFTNLEQTYGLPLPTVLMEYGQFNWVTIGKNMQKGEGVLRFYVYFENYADSFSGSINQDLALQFFEFTEQVNIALQGLSVGNILSPLERVTDAEDIDQDMIITSILEYSCTISDQSTDDTRNHIEVDPELDVNYNKTSTRPPLTGEPAFLV